VNHLPICNEEDFCPGLGFIICFIGEGNADVNMGLFLPLLFKWSHQLPPD